MHSAETSTRCRADRDQVSSPRCGVCRWQGSEAGETIGQQGIDLPRERDRRAASRGLTTRLIVREP
jgi:hypothetical protein